jgi:hypothetical protein
VLHDHTFEKINFEIEEVEKLLTDYSMLIDIVKNKKPDLVEITATATVLHSFYNGIEKIFQFIAKEIDNDLPDGTRWHTDLILKMCRDNGQRKRVISEELLIIMLEYMAFRHFFRHSYSFQLKWEKIEHISVNITENWSLFKKEIEAFMCKSMTEI